MATDSDLVDMLDQVPKNIFPIKAFISPSKSREKQDIFSKLESIIIVLIKNYYKWEDAQKRGTSLCSSIAILKTKAFETKIPASELSLYPDNLQQYCDKLAIILRICEDVIKITEPLIKQTKGLVLLNKNSNETFFRTWSIENLQEFIEKVYEMYNKEIIIKRTVTAEIAHCQNKNKLLVYAKAWEYPEYTDEDMRLQFNFLRQEIKGLIKVE
ncbi:cyclin-dependent kinase 2-interacting protein [Condylostylus longicornis]|uniref:cyclin-dependent kinase 2-interacting protein n=1 Tax=Condylostylus longicornis TaxID=2530218 RepID=UPI00244DE444|nr:cyclin-dependent kinase 2-interacting protein [Condylostylus longicornis]